MRPLRLAIQWLLFLAWGVLGSLVCYLGYRRVHDPQAQGAFSWTAAWVWMVLTLAVLIFVLFCSRPGGRRVFEKKGTDSGNDEDDGGHRDLVLIRLGLVAAFSTAIPGLVIALLALVISFPRYLDSIGDERSDQLLRLTGAPITPATGLAAGKGAAGEGVHYIVAVDVSLSFLTASDEDRITAIRSLFSTLINYQDNFQIGQIFKPQDSITLVTFAGEDVPALPRSKVGGSDREALVERLAEALRRELHSSTFRATHEPTRTDFVELLEGVRDLIGGDEGKHSRFVALIVSDFLHDTPLYFESAARERLSKVVQQLGEDGRTHLLAVVGRGDGAREARAISALDPLRSIVEDGMLREVNLEEFDDFPTASTIAAFVLGVLPWETPDGKTPAQLRYATFPSWRSGAFELLIPEQFRARTAIVGFRTSAQSGGPNATLRLRLGLEESSSILDSSSKEQRQVLGRMRLTDRNGLPITLEAKPSGSEVEEADLMVAFAGDEMAHCVRVVFVPVLGEVPRMVFEYSLLFLLGAIGILTAAGCLASTKEDRRGMFGAVGASWAGRRRRKQEKVEVPSAIGSSNEGAR